MGLFTRSFRVLRNDVYDKVPVVSCQACGDCCVSPHITMVEFCYMMTPLLKQKSILPDLLNKNVKMHPVFNGNLTCRFQSQSGGQCQAYENRPLVCRLHGHTALESMGLKYHAHCPKARSLGRELSPHEIYSMMDQLAELNQRFYLHYTQPYWLSALNVEGWLTVLFNKWPQAYFNSLADLMIEALGKGVLELAPLYKQTVRLGEKLELIEDFHENLAAGKPESLIPLLDRIRDDFPETGAYYYFEADMYRSALEDKRSEMPDFSLNSDTGGTS